ncbi:hypothetical protein EOA31_26550 [Mesorhizobium sp. M4B.F.Ca.ET.049.02.1.2]|nr:hypothetical protein EOA31_26550 [Mesorhizobium sp. M4B.F.Ca.ET.049.02.1.2]
MKRKRAAGAALADDEVATAVSAVQRFMRSLTRPNYLFLRNSGRKTAAHFSWNCTRRPARISAPRR